MNARYAIYFIPEQGTFLAEQGSALLGRDSESGKEIYQTSLSGFSQDRLYSLTTTARRYGLHATLKAPFFLQHGQTEPELLDAAACFMLGRTGLTLPRLEVERIGSFFALVPARQTAAEQMAVENLNTFAAEAVSFFDSFRAVPSEEEIARREPHKLNPRQRELLTAWGYPYVFDEYRFHITLTDKVSEQAEAVVLEERLHEYFRPVTFTPVHINSICICRQERGNAASAAHSTPGNFTLLQRFFIGRA